MPDIVSSLDEAGATLVAITSQLVEHNKAMTEKHGLNFEMLSDPGNSYLAELGLKFNIPAEVKAIYQGFGLDIPATNGDDGWTLPMLGRIFVDSSGVVRATDIDANYTSRPEPEKTLADVQAL
jgi:peroxiredoxin